MSPTHLSYKLDYNKSVQEFEKPHTQNGLLEKYRMLSILQQRQAALQKLQEKHMHEKQLYTSENMNGRWNNNNINNATTYDSSKNDLRQNNSNVTNNEYDIVERFKKLSTEDTMQLRTLRVQESIRQTLAASNGFHKEGLEDVTKNPELLHQLSLQDLNIVDMLADPRWSGMKYYGGTDYRNDFSRKDHSKYF